MLLGLLNKWEIGEWEGHLVCIGEERNTHKTLVVKLQERRPFGWSRHDLKEMGCEGGDWIHLAHDRM
jgi:hypothetical protein